MLRQGAEQSRFLFKAGGESRKTGSQNEIVRSRRLLAASILTSGVSSCIASQGTPR